MMMIKKLDNARGCCVKKKRLDGLVVYTSVKIIN